MKNRTITGHWDGEVISRPKTLGERHPHMMQPKHKALISKEELHKKFVERHGGSKSMALKAKDTREKIHSHSQKEMSSSERKNYQHRIGRAYSE